MLFSKINSNHSITLLGVVIVKYNIVLHQEGNLFWFVNIRKIWRDPYLLLINVFWRKMITGVWIMDKRGLLAGIGIPALVLIFIFLIGGLIGNVTDSNGPAISDEEKYLQGIEFIKQENWEKATMALVFLKEEDYKDSKILYNYAQSHEHLNNDYRDIDMAVYYVNSIPNNYDGVFKDDILKFKQEVIQEGNDTTEEDKDRRWLEYARSRGLFDLEAISFKWYISHSYAIAEGQVKNITSTSMDNIMAVITYKTKDGMFITYDKALIEYATILPDQVSPFKIITPYNPEMDTAYLEFAKFNGEKINTDYTYNK